MLDRSTSAAAGRLPKGRRPGARRRAWRGALAARRAHLVRAGFALLAAATDASAIIVTALATALAYHAIFYAPGDVAEFYLQIGCVIALLFVLPSAYRKDYAIYNYMGFEAHLSRSFMCWNLAFVSALTMGFLTKTTEVFSRGSVILFYFVGWGTLAAARLALVRIVRQTSAAGSVSARRVFLVGFEEQIVGFTGQYQPRTLAMHVVGATVLRREEGTLADDLALAAAAARMMRPDDVFILVPWPERAVIDSCLDAFMQVPASIHLGPERVLDRFVDAHVSKIGPISSLQLVRAPLTTAEIVIKRLVDVVGASLLLIALAPFFLLVALIIKLDSKGPVFFLQRRYGFNQEMFRIVKFRSMTTLDDGPHVPQAARGDARVTRVGRFLRRWNIDELPQLFNVLKGEMSLVGPRPHALAHNQQYEQRIALYARRHNVRPGITGWAQVNGFRGETATEERMRARVEHDLYYIDNWSLWLDLRILAMTLSPKAFRNAY